MKICAILPMKHNSSRVPGKNYRNFNGKPSIVVEKESGSQEKEPPHYS